MIKIDFEKDEILVEENDKINAYNLGTPEAFNVLSKAWLRCGWDNKYVYSFTWMGRPIIQLPDDMVRIQELIYSIKPDVIIETGIAHGGSLVFSASLCKAMGRGRIIGVDVEIRPHNREAIEEHDLFSYITMIEGDSIAPEIIAKVASQLNEKEVILIFLDSCHTKSHVLSELNAYAPFVSKGSYIVAMDGIMKDLVGAPRSSPDWNWNNPSDAAFEFVENNENYIIDEPIIPFNEGTISEKVTYLKNAYIKRIG